MTPKQHLEELLTLMATPGGTPAKIKGRLSYMASDTQGQPAQAFADCLEPLAAIQKDEEKGSIYHALIHGITALFTE